jgi:hypothetical protein
LAHNEKERREFFRLNYKTPVEFKTYPQNQTLAQRQAGISENISEAGLLFQTENIPPQVSSILWMNLDMRTLKICQEIESKCLIFNNGVLAKVVRVEEGSDDIKGYDVGVCFLKKDQSGSREVQEILKQVESKA